MATGTNLGNGTFDFAVALSKVDPKLVTVFGPTLRDAAPQEFQAIASAVPPKTM